MFTAKTGTLSSALRTLSKHESQKNIRHAIFKTNALPCQQF